MRKKETLNALTQKPARTSVAGFLHEFRREAEQGYEPVIQ